MNDIAGHNTKEVVKLKRDYTELLTEIEALLSSDSQKMRHRIIGAFTTAGTLTEKILLWIIRYNGRQDQLTQLDGRQGVFEYQKMVKDVIPRQQIIHINTINQWRNLVAHANDIEDVDEHEINAIYSALKSFVEWFFEDYLGEKHLPLEKEKVNVSPETGHATSQTKQVTPESNETNILKKNGLAKWLMLLGVLIVVVFPLIYYQLNKSDSDIKVIPEKRDINKEEVYNILTNYFNSIRDKNASARDFFANRISRFYLYENINPTKVDIIRKTEIDYIDRRDAIDKESLSLHHKTDSISYWRFWNDFACYRTTKRKFQTCKVLMEFGFNNKRKIMSIIEIEVRDLKFSKRKPY